MSGGITLLHSALAPVPSENWSDALQDELAEAVFAITSHLHSAPLSNEPHAAFYRCARSATNPRFSFVFHCQQDQAPFPLDPACAYYVFTATPLLETYGLPLYTAAQTLLTVVLEIPAQELVGFHNTFLPQILPPPQFPFEFVAFWASTTIAHELEIPLPLPAPPLPAPAPEAAELPPPQPPPFTYQVAPAA